MLQYILISPVELLDLLISKFKDQDDGVSSCVFLLLQVGFSWCSACVHGPAKYRFPQTKSIQSQLEGRWNTVGLLSRHPSLSVSDHFTKILGTFEDLCNGSHLCCIGNARKGGTMQPNDSVEIISLTFTIHAKWSRYSVFSIDFGYSSGQAMWLPLVQMCLWIFNAYWYFNFLEDWKGNSRVRIWPTKLLHLCAVYLCKCQYFKVSSSS